MGAGRSRALDGAVLRKNCIGKERGIVTKEFLTSGEFASLRNVNLNSLRYYEKMKLLTPAWVDPKTKYRYYRLEQLSTLDTILFFIEVGMPLSSLKNYVGSDGTLDQISVLRDGKKAMEDKIASIKTRLAVTEFDLMNLEQNRWCNQQEGIFTREIEERFFMVAPFQGEWEEPARRENEALALFHQAGTPECFPSFPRVCWCAWIGSRRPILFSCASCAPLRAPARLSASPRGPSPACRPSWCRSSTFPG